MAAGFWVTLFIPVPVSSNWDSSARRPQTPHLLRECTWIIRKSWERLYQIKAGSDTTTYAYFDNGNRSLLTYPNGLTAEYTYYADNRLHTLANKNGSTIINAYNYAYDNNGNMVTKLDISGTTTYNYDALNRLASVTVPGGKVTAYSFDGAGNRDTHPHVFALIQLIV